MPPIFKYLLGGIFILLCTIIFGSIYFFTVISSLQDTSQLQQEQISLLQQLVLAEQKVTTLMDASGQVCQRTLTDTLADLGLDIDRPAIPAIKVPKGMSGMGGSLSRGKIKFRKK